MIQTDWVQIAITAGSGFLGVASGYGYMKARLSSLEKSQDEHNKRLFDIEKRTTNLVLRDGCAALRNGCHDNIVDKFNEVKKMITDNRTVVETKFAIITEFMGYVRGILESKLK